MKKQKFTSLLISIGICLAVIIALITVLAISASARNRKAQAELETVSLVPIETETTEPEPEPINFVIFGIDTVGYTPDDIYRSDIIMLVSLDQADEKIKLISILRDSKVPIDGLEPQKINAAYQAGGAPLALKTINDSFHLDVQDYLTLNFQDMVFLVDDIGGIDVEISAAEAEQINSMVRVDISEDGRNAYCEDVYEGIAHLDGMQATDFSRIRKIDGDNVRAVRQHRTIRAIQKKVQTMSVADFPWLVQCLLDNVVETSLSFEDLSEWMSLGIVNYEIDSYIVPDEAIETNVVSGPDETGWWVWQYDLEEASRRIHSIIWD